MKMQVEVFWIVKPCNVVVGYQRFGGPCCLHLQVVTTCNVVVGHQRFGGPYCLHLQVEDRGVTVHKTATCEVAIYTVVSTSLIYFIRWRDVV